MGYLRKGAIKIILDSRLEDVWMVGVAVRTFCLEAGFNQDTSASIEVALVEAVNNIIIHAYHYQSGYSVEIGVTLDPERIVFHIEDEGEGISQGTGLESPMVPQDIGSLREGGYGLVLIKGIMDQVEYKSMGKRNSLTMSKAFT